MSFDKCNQFYKHHHNQIIEQFHHFQNSIVPPCSQPLLIPQGSCNYKSIFCPHRFVSSGKPYICSYTACSLWGLVSFSLPQTSEIIHAAVHSLLLLRGLLPMNVPRCNHHQLTSGLFLVCSDYELISFTYWFLRKYNFLFFLGKYLEVGLLHCTVSVHLVL